MNLKPLLPAAALLVLLMPSEALSKNHHNFDDLGNSATVQAGSLTPFSNLDGKNCLNGNVSQFSNGFDPTLGVNQYANGFAPTLGVSQYGNYGNLSNNPYDAGVNSNGYNLSNRAKVHHHGGCNSPRSQMERAMRNAGVNPNSNPYLNAYNNSQNNPNINPYANPVNNPYANPYANPNAAAFNGANPYGNAYANPYANPYANGYNGNNGFINNATSASNLSRLGSVLSGSGLGNLGAYAQNGSLNGGSLSGLRGLLGI